MGRKLATHKITRSKGKQIQGAGRIILMMLYFAFEISPGYLHEPVNEAV